MAAAVCRDSAVKSLLDFQKAFLLINCFPNELCCLSAAFAVLSLCFPQLAPDGKYSLEIGWLFKCSSPQPAQTNNKTQQQPRKSAEQNAFDSVVHTPALTSSGVECFFALGNWDFSNLTNSLTLADDTLQKIHSTPSQISVFF